MHNTKGTQLIINGKMILQEILHSSTELGFRQPDTLPHIDLAIMHAMHCTTMLPTGKKYRNTTACTCRMHVPSYTCSYSQRPVHDPCQPSQVACPTRHSKGCSSSCPAADIQQTPSCVCAVPSMACHASAVLPEESNNRETHMNAAASQTWKLHNAYHSASGQQSVAA